MEKIGPEENADKLSKRQTETQSSGTTVIRLIVKKILLIFHNCRQWTKASMSKLWLLIWEKWKFFGWVYGSTVGGMLSFIVFFIGEFKYNVNFYKFGWSGVSYVFLVIPLSISLLAVIGQYFFSHRRWPTLWQVFSLISLLAVLAVSGSFVLDATLYYTELVVMSDKYLQRIELLAKSDHCWFLAFPRHKKTVTYNLQAESSETEIRTFPLSEEIHYGQYEIHLDYLVEGESRSQVLYRHFHTKKDTLLW